MPTDFGVLLNLAFGAFKHKLEEDLAQGGFTDLGPAFGYVLRLLDDAPHSLTELAAKLQMSAPGALKVVDDMVAKGYVTRVGDEHDRRVKRLGLTPRGRSLLLRARKFHTRFEQSLAEQLGTRRVMAARQVLEHLSETVAAPDRRHARPV